jgi:hypothetical protein
MSAVPCYEEAFNPELAENAEISFHEITLGAAHDLVDQTAH